MLVNLEINRENLEKNLKKVRSINKNLICVVKDNAYGLGIENIFPILLENGCNYFAMAYIDEALKIREILENLKKENLEKDKKLKIIKNKKINIMSLNYIEPENLKYAIENDIEPTVFNLSQLSDYLKILDKFFENTILKIHIKVNSGMNRLGFNENEILDLIGKIKKYKMNLKNNKLEIISIFSHISDAENQAETEKQVQKYENILKIFNENGIKYQYRHLQASPLLFEYGQKYNYDFARVGMTLYGMEEDKEIIPNPSHIIDITHSKNQAIVLIKANMRATSVYGKIDF